MKRWELVWVIIIALCLHYSIHCTSEQPSTGQSAVHDKASVAWCLWVTAAGGSRSRRRVRHQSQSSHPATIDRYQNGGRLQPQQFCYRLCGIYQCPKTPLVYRCLVQPSLPEQNTSCTHLMKSLQNEGWWFMGTLSCLLSSSSSYVSSM